MVKVRREREQERTQAGLCADCRHSRKMTSDRGAVFWLCELSKVDAGFAKYPQLPMRACAGYESVEKEAVEPESGVP